MFSKSKIVSSRNLRKRSGRGKREINLLLVEDSQKDAFLIQELISEVNNSEIKITINHAVSLSQALDIFSEGEEFSAILLDLFLPDSKGIETIEKALLQMPECPIIVVTNLKDDELGYHALNIGAQDFIVKEELNPKTILKTVMHTLERCAYRRFCDNFKSLEFIKKEMKIADKLCENLDSIIEDESLYEKPSKEMTEHLTSCLETMMDKGVVQMICNVDLEVSKELYNLAKSMKELRIKSSDIIRIYKTALSNRCKGISDVKAEAIVEESRILILELISYMIVLYKEELK